MRLPQLTWHQEPTIEPVVERAIAEAPAPPRKVSYFTILSAVLRDPDTLIGMSILVAISVGGIFIINEVGISDGQVLEPSAFQKILYGLMVLICAGSALLAAIHPFVVTRRVLSAVRNGTIATARILTISRKRAARFSTSVITEWRMNLKAECQTDAGGFQAGLDFQVTWGGTLEEGDFLRVLCYPHEKRILFVLPAQPRTAR